MKYVCRLEEITKEDTAIAGGKGANMGEMIRIGMPVPPGFVVTTAAFYKLIQIHDIGEKIRTMLDPVNVEDTNMLMATSQRIKELIISQGFPNEIKSEIIESYKKLFSVDKDVKSGINLTESDAVFVVVRSSATAEDLPEASFAVQQARFINVNHKIYLIEAV